MPSRYSPKMGTATTTGVSGFSDGARNEAATTDATTA
jgi:hypothetical protein